MTDPTPSSRHRWWYSIAAVAALAVTIVFVTVGDGVQVPEAAGVRRGIVDHGHALTWALLTGALTVAAVSGRWSRISQVLAIAAGASYVLFLSAVLL